MSNCSHSRASAAQEFESDLGHAAETERIIQMQWLSISGTQQLGVRLHDELAPV
jgi:hypothetical protein